jgi:hypothetical protein
LEFGVRSTGDGNYGKLSNLYSSSTVAFDADTGKIKWWVQATPEDAWDYDGVNELVLADLAIAGKKTPVYMKAGPQRLLSTSSTAKAARSSRPRSTCRRPGHRRSIVATASPTEDPTSAPAPTIRSRVHART